jgi:N-acetylmuramoyl-L-alanine amidase
VPVRRQPTPTAAARESLHITVVYPAATDVIQSHDSAFLFGAVRGGGEGPRSFTIDGRPVPLRANGAWIAWLPLPADTLAPFRLAARAGADSSVTLFTARVAPQYRPPANRSAWIDTTSFTPAGSLALPLGEGILLTVHAAPGASR